MRIKSNAENRNTKSHNLTVGDYVIFQQPKINKWTHHINQNIIEFVKLRAKQFGQED